MKGLKKCPMVWLPGSDALPTGAVKDLVLAAEENGGWLELDNPAIFDGMKYKLSDLATALIILSDPRHPQNNWSCLAEKVYMVDRLYLHLVNCIPEWVKSSWETSGPPPFGAAWMTPSLVESLFPEASKPVAPKLPTKKAKPVREKTPAKKLEPAIKLTPKQKEQALAEKIALEYVNSIFSEE